MDLRLGGCGGVYFYASPGELWVEVQKQDLNRRTSRTHLRALLFAPDRRVVDEAWLGDDQQPTNSGPGPVKRSRLHTQVKRPGVYGLNITVTEDRYGENMSWGFKSNCRTYLIETSRGHRDARHEEPIVLRNSGQPGDVGFMPRTRPFSIEVSGLAAEVKALPVYDRHGDRVTTLAVSPEGKAGYDFPADPSRQGALWRLHLTDAQAVIQIDGVTRWRRGEAWEDLSLWTPELSSWFAFPENRWLLTPYRRTLYAEAGSAGTVNFHVHNNGPGSKRVRLSLEFDEGAAWSARLPSADIELEAHASAQVPLAYEVPWMGNQWQCNILQGRDQTYHLFVCRWREDHPKGHMAWPTSEVVRAVSKHRLGPYRVAEVIGPGHNPEAYPIKDGRYVCYVINGYYLGPTLAGPWERRQFEFDPRDRKTVAGLSNLSFCQREDGSYLMVNRGGGMWVSRDGLSVWEQVTQGSMYPKVKGRFEDSVLWRTEVQYHMIVNDWYGRIAYHLRSKDGVHWKVDAGEAYMPGIAVSEDGKRDDWYKYERIKIFQDKHGRAVQANFAVIDYSKREDKPNDIHSSKNICIPLTPGRLLTLLNRDRVTEDTEEIRLRIAAEPGFDQHRDIRLDSLRFGAPEAVDFGRG